MELLALLRVLWRHRLVVVAGVVVALAVGFLAMRGSTMHSGVASAKVLVDTQASEIVDANPPGAPTLGWRTDLLASVMATDAVRAQIARSIGAPPDDVVLTIPAQAAPAVAMTLPVGALDAASASAASEPFQVDFQALSLVPIIRIDVRAPGRSQAARLAAVAADLVKRAARAPAKTTPGFPDLSPQDLAVRDVGPVKSREIVNAPRRMKAAMAAMAVLVLWCMSALPLMTAIGRTRRAPRRASPSVVA